MKSIKRICAVLLGFVFFVAGLLKLMDPVGAGLVVSEYYNFLHLSFLAPSASVVGDLLALFEALLGAALISGAFPLIAGVLSGVVLVVFTALTLVLWLVNPAMDCGCFGEAVHLDPFKSFVKNIVLCLLWLVAFVPFRSVRRPRKVKYVSFGIAAVSIVLFAVNYQLNVPALDFTPFAPGATLMQAQESPEPDAPLLSVCDAEGEYCDSVLAVGNKLVISVYDDDHLGAAVQERVARCVGAFVDSAASVDSVASVDSAASTASAASAASAVEAVDAGAASVATALDLVLVASGEFPGVQDFYTADRRTLMTLNRSNGGATLLRDGVIVAKWPSRALPTASELAPLLELPPTEAMLKHNNPRRLKLQGFLLYVTAVLVLL